MSSLLGRVMPQNMSTFIEMLFKVWLMDSMHLNSLGCLWKKKFLSGLSLCSPQSEYLEVFFFLLCVLKRPSNQKAYLFWTKENLAINHPDSRAGRYFFLYLVFRVLSLCLGKCLLLSIFQRSFGNDINR